MSRPYDLIEQWTAAEATADTAALDALLADEFVGVGPLGFVLDKPGWVGRYEGGLAISALTVDDVSVREHDDLAVAVAVQTQEATYQGNPTNGRFRVTVVARRHEGGRLVLSVHLSGPIPAGARS